MKAEFKDITPEKAFNFVLKVKLKWSKNILDDRAPTQFMIPSMEPNFCVLLNLVCYLESADQQNLLSTNFIFTSWKGHTIATRKINKVIKTTGHQGLGQNWHSQHPKGAGTYLGLNGSSDQDVIRRGRWRDGKNSVIARYIDFTLAGPDALAA